MYQVSFCDETCFFQQSSYPPVSTSYSQILVYPPYPRVIQQKICGWCLWVFVGVCGCLWASTAVEATHSRSISIATTLQCKAFIQRRSLQLRRVIMTECIRGCSMISRQHLSESLGNHRVRERTLHRW